MDSPDVNGTLTFFSTALEAGRVVLGKDAKALFKTFVLLEVVFAGIYIAIGGSADLRAIAKKILVIGFFSYVIANYSELLSIVLDGFVSSGAKAAGASGSSIGSMKDPAGIFVLGCQKIKPLLDKEGQGDWFSFSLTSILFFVLGVISTLAYGLMAMQVFVTYLE